MVDAVPSTNACRVGVSREDDMVPVDDRLPAQLDLLPGEAALVHRYLGDIVACLLGTEAPRVD